ISNMLHDKITLYFRQVNNYYNVPNNVEKSLFVKNYASIILKNIWKGIDLKLYSNNGVVENDWVIHNAKDYMNVKFKVSGGDLKASNGYLIISTPLGDIREGKLNAFQGEERVDANWVVNNDTVSFEINDYVDSLPIVIDPPSLLWSTYYGGDAPEEGNSTVTDELDNVFISGTTSSASNIATVGAHQGTFNDGFYDAFLIKFDGNGNRIWGTYYGGDDVDYSNSCDYSNGNVYISGGTSSSNNIALNGHQNSFGGNEDAFLVKFNSNGIREWATYYGGDSNTQEHAYSCSTDDLGNVYLVGQTGSQNNISTPGSHQPNLVLGQSPSPVDGFLAKFDGDGNRLWGTYYGGDLNDEIRSVDVSEDGNLVFISGYTASDNNIATSGTHQTVNGGVNDSFLAKFNSDGIRQWGTYFGGNDNDRAYSCSIESFVSKINSSTNELYIYMTGETESANNISTSGSHQDNFGGGFSDGFLAKFNNDGLIEWSTYFGGSADDISRSCYADNKGKIYVTGNTSSDNNISTPNSYQETRSGNSFDGFLSYFKSDGTRICSTYFGGDLNEESNSCYSDQLGNVYIHGTTGSLDNISTSGSHQENYGGGSEDAFLTKFTDCSSVGLFSNKLDTNIMRVYPNPSNGDVNIYSGIQGKYQLRIYSSNGKTVFSDWFNKSFISVDLRNQLNGMYVVEIKGYKSELIQSSKFFIVK
ncbi:MAG: SBBP repeat-containing protein, partial [Brumimicrobium sp.]